MRGKMPTIRVDPAVLNNSASNVNNAAGGITNAGNNANSAAASAPSYDGQFGPKVMALGNEAKTIAKSKAENLTYNASKLSEYARIFYSVDSTAIDKKYPWPWLPRFPIHILPINKFIDIKQGWLRRATIFPISFYPAPFISVTLVKLLNLGSLKLQNIKYPNTIYPTSLNPKSVDVTSNPKKTGFGLLIEKAKLEEEDRKKKEQELAAAKVDRNSVNKPVDFPETSQKWQNYYEVTPQSQKGLEYQGGKTQYGCVPTSTSMILNYWHEKDTSLAAISSQELVNANVAQKEFDSTGMSASKIKDDLEKIGYTSADHNNSDIETLKGELKAGPVIAIVKLNMAASGNNHAVVVSGISELNEVRVVDPWTGKAKTYDWNTFSKSWGANFGKDKPRNNLVTITPK
jgi:hypothetical protein